jgi:hypothetical protein
MGKKRAQKDRGYITAKEHQEEWGGYKDKRVSSRQGARLGAHRPYSCLGSSTACLPPPTHSPPTTTKKTQRAGFARLPFNCCAINFTPFEDPVCTDDGTVYDIVAVVPYVRKFGKHPVKGTPLSLGDLIHLNFHKNAGGWTLRLGSRAALVTMTAAAVFAIGARSHPDQSFVHTPTNPVTPPPQTASTRAPSPARSSPTTPTSSPSRPPATSTPGRRSRS